MRQLIDIPAGLDALATEGKTAALATVVAVEGSAYRRPGARMLIAEDGRTWGGVSGGCLERDVAQRGRGVIVTGRPVLHRYDTVDDEGLSLGAATGCGGSVEIFIQPVSAADPGPVEAMRRAVHQRTTTPLATVIRNHGSLSIDPGTCMPLTDLPARLRLAQPAAIGLGLVRLTVPRGDVEVFIERIEPPQALVIFGAGPDVVPLVSIARSLGWHITIVGARPATQLHERFADVEALHLTSSEDPLGGVSVAPDAAVCVMTHNLARDARILNALPADLPYVGLLGPRHRTDRVMLEVHRERPIERLHNPIGLDLGAETSEEIALAIAAEIQSVRRQRTGRPLAELPGPIHLDPPHASTGADVAQSGDVACPA